MFKVINLLLANLAESIVAFNLHWNPPAPPAPLPPGIAAALQLLAIPAIPALPAAPVPILTNHAAAAYARFWHIRGLFDLVCWVALFFPGMVISQASLNTEGISHAVATIFSNEGNDSRERFASPSIAAILLGFQHWDFGPGTGQINWTLIIAKYIYDTLSDAEKLQYVNRVLQSAIKRFFGHRLAFVVDHFVTVTFRAIMLADESLSMHLLLPILSDRLNMLKLFDPAPFAAAHAILPPGAIDLEQFIRQAMIDSITITIDSHCIMAITRNRSVAQDAADAFTSHTLKQGGGGAGGRRGNLGGGRGEGGGGGGGGAAPFVAAPIVAAPAIVQPNHGVKRQLTNQQELADWYAIAPYPNLRMCWNYLTKTGVCKGMTTCQRKDKQPHFFPKGYDQKLYMAWLKKKPT